MQGEDDLVYTIHDHKRPDFSAQGGKIQSSGRYTWFFTFMPETGTDPKVAVDVLACFNRIPEDDRQVQPSTFSPSRRGGTFTLDHTSIDSTLYPNTSISDISGLLTQTKYVFVTWETSAGVNGAWCRIVFVDRSLPSSPKVIVTGNLTTIGNNIQVYIPSGVLYHTQVLGVAIE